MLRHENNFRYRAEMDIGYARVSTAKQDLGRQFDALAAAGITMVFADKRSGATRDRPGLQDALRQPRAGDVIVVHTLDRLGRTVRDTLNLMHELKEREVGIRTLADPLRIDTSSPDSPMAQVAVVMLALFAEMERTYAAERAAHARAVATANGRRTGRPSVVDPDKLEHALMLRDKGTPMREIVTKTVWRAPHCTDTFHRAKLPTVSRAESGWGALSSAALEAYIPIRSIRVIGPKGAAGH